MNSEWFSQAKLGLFIHWGLYAAMRGSEWSIYRDRIDLDTYKKHMNYFNPDRFDANQWVEMAKNAGMKYVVITSKHHDGFCMFDSKYTDWKITNTPFKRDVVAELAVACRNAGLKFGIYFSIWDLAEEGLCGKYKDADFQDIGADGEFGGNEWKPSDEGVEYMHNQIEELLTNYGKVDIFWFDVMRSSPKNYQAEKIMKRMKELQPHMLINERLVVGDKDLEHLADIKCPENTIPKNGLVDDEGKPVLWESCMCYNDHWSYMRNDQNWKGIATVTHQLSEIAGKGGNLLLNVGPTGRGDFPKPFRTMLTELGEWVDLNAESIFNTTPSKIADFAGNEVWDPFFYDNFRWRAVFTHAPNHLYVHILNYPSDRKIMLPQFKDVEIEHIYMLDDHCDLRWTMEGYLSLKQNEITIELPEVHNKTTNVVVIKYNAKR